MPTLSDLQAQVKRGKKLLAGELPDGDRMKVAKLTLLAQAGVLLRQRTPDFDEKANREPKGPKEPPQS